MVYKNPPDTEVSRKRCTPERQSAYLVSSYWIIPCIATRLTAKSMRLPVKILFSIVLLGVVSDCWLFVVGVSGRFEIW